MMDRNELIAGVIVALAFLFALAYPGIISANCKIEAIKAGMKAEDITKVCKM